MIFFAIRGMFTIETSPILYRVTLHTNIAMTNLILWRHTNICYRFLCYYFCTNISSRNFNITCVNWNLKDRGCPVESSARTWPNNREFLNIKTTIFWQEAIFTIIIIVYMFILPFQLFISINHMLSETVSISVCSYWSAQTKANPLLADLYPIINTAFALNDAHARAHKHTHKSLYTKRRVSKCFKDLD